VHCHSLQKKHWSHGGHKVACVEPPAVLPACKEEAVVATDEEEARSSALLSAAWLALAAPPGATPATGRAGGVPATATATCAGAAAHAEHFRERASSSGCW